MDQKLVRILLITGNLSPMHDYRTVNKLLREVLELTDHFTVRICEAFPALSDASLADYDLLLINYDGMEHITGHDMGRTKPTTLGPDAEARICRFVEQGGGALLYHSTVNLNDAFSPGFLELAGCRDHSGQYKPYRETGYTIDMHPGHPITEGITPHWKLCDDDFFNWVDVTAADATVLASIHDPANERDVPVAWAREQGKGRVVAISLGHQQDTIRRLDFVRLFVRSCDWAATGQITAPMPDRESGENWMRGWPWYYKDPAPRRY